MWLWDSSYLQELEDKKRQTKVEAAQRDVLYSQINDLQGQMEDLQQVTTQTPQCAHRQNALTSRRGPYFSTVACSQWGLCETCNGVSSQRWDP